MKKILAAILSLVMAASLTTGCGSPAASDPVPAPAPESSAAPSATPEAAPAGTVDPSIKATLTFAAWDTAAIALYESLDLEGRFQKLYPNVTIEIEQSKDDSEYWNSMKIRSSANQLPDIMYNKPFTLSRFQDYLLDLSDLSDVVADNTLASGYTLDGKVLGIPEKSVSDYVYYWSDMFTEAGVAVPQTWDEMIAASKKLQEYFGAKDKDYSAIAIGGKDEWPTYPFTEFMPALISGNGQNWNTMATQDAPFAEGTDINKAFNKVYSLFTAGVCGKDPLGIGHDQAVGLFAQKKASIIVAGPWCLTNIAAGTDSTEGLKTFYLPVRDKTSDAFNIIAQGDNFMGVTTHSKNPELAKEFIKFYFSDAWYPDYIAAIGDDSTMKSFPKAKDPILAEADKAQPKAVSVMYDGGGDNFSAIQSEVKFDYKKLGAQMFVEGFDLKAELGKLDTAWAAARKTLGIK
ncbi:MAG: extracellular solute-binding protein [Angelakisella sp.]